jgi:hypothetical protein
MDILAALADVAQMAPHQAPLYDRTAPNARC